MKITIRTIPHDSQRYETCGDWEWDGNNLTISVSEMGNWRYEMLVAFHEMAECLICRHRGIRQTDVDEFDMQFEKQRKPRNTDEPGDDPTAPYYREHQFATCVERLLALELNVDWKRYDDTVNSL